MRYLPHGVFSSGRVLSLRAAAYALLKGKGGLTVSEREAMEPELKRLVRRGIVRHLYKKGVITRLEAEKLLEEGRL